MELNNINIDLKSAGVGAGATVAIYFVFKGGKKAYKYFKEKKDKK